ncbi:MAG: SurA N-terminal domain-containing protein [Treponema sp.]|jgi:parvulin-like peptidyl-prolyl isomerase|nr:SurA N-terminal domain-containing protein [Treponema sp.]
MKRIIFILIGLLTAVNGFSQSTNLLQPAATVNLIRTEAITVGQLRTEVLRYEQAASRTFTQAERLQILDVMINERLVLQAAERDRVLVSDNEVNQQIQALRNNLAEQLGRQPTDAEYAQAVMNDSGLDVNAFRDQIRKQMIIQKYLLHRKGDLINSARVPTEAEILTEYNLLRSELMRPETIRFSMIQVPFGADAAARTRARTLADSLHREISNDPARFDAVVSRSVAPNSGFQAGDAGYIPRTQEARNVLGQQFMDTAFNLRQGQVSQIIEGIQGFQIIKITENHAAKALELNDIFQLGTRVTVREYLGQLMLQQRQQNVINQASQELVTEFRTSRTFTVFENNIRW